MRIEKVSLVGLGLAALGRPGYINLGHGDDLRGHTDVDAMERNAHGVLDSGVTLIRKPFSIQEISAKVRQVLDG